MPHTLNLSEVALNIFKTLYSLNGETIPDTFKRVAKEFSTNEDEINIAYGFLHKNIWRPNTPVFFNAGTEHKMFSACWVVGLEDSMNSIYNIGDLARKIFQHGAGIGIPIGNLREENAPIYEGKKGFFPPIGDSSGAVSFMKLYDIIGETTKSGGRTRRAAILCSMPINHPDIMSFIKCKQIDGVLSNMNISVNITDTFMQALKDNVSYPLISPTGEERGEINAKLVWDALVEMSHQTGDPGILFIDTINKANFLKSKIQIQCTNPCGEQPLIPFTSCNLSSINVHKFYQKGKFDMKGLYETAYMVMVMMDNVIDVMFFPDKRFEDNVKKYRPVGIGIMGLADVLFELDLPYNSKEARDISADIMKNVTSACIDASIELAKKKGKFHLYERYENDILEIITQQTDNNLPLIERVKKHGLRNIQFTTCAPTGTIALSCDCSYGIEPCFGLVFQKNMMDGKSVIIANPVFKKKFEKESWYDDKILEKIFQNGGSLKGLRGIPKEVKDIFLVAHDIDYRDRIDMQSELQKYCSAAISSTINLPTTTTKEEISDLYMYAYEKGLKGVTIYRDGSKHSQPITFTKEGEVKSNFNRPKKLVSETHVLETGNGKIYVIVSKHNNKPVEVFMNMGKSGQVFNVFSEALGRVMSIALQHGVPLEEIVKTMIGINSDKPHWFRFDENDNKPTQILSIPDGIAQLLKRFYLDKVVVNDSSSFELCPKCGTYSLIMSEGCKVCQNCGDSACG